MTALRPSRIEPTRLFGAALGGLAVGVATSYLQGALPGSWNTVANSGAVWTVVAFGLAALSVRTRWTAIAAGVLALLGEVAGYYALASPARGIATTLSERVLWTMAALVIGPLAGAAGYYWRRGSATERVAAAVGLCGVVLGEGVHELVRISADPGAGWAELVLGGGFAGVAVLASSVPLRGRVVAVAVGVLTAGAVYLSYGDALLA
ncbi:MAG: hypothetical protein JWP39_2985 [Jatrophihabitans sp.]|nr:hypothetical protein [Jatrophihabitans sp.]